MKVQKIVLALLLSLASFSCLFAQRTVEKTLVKSFNLQGYDVVDLNLTGDIEVQEWDSPSIRVEMLITVENGNETMVKSLMRAGRYNLKSVQTDSAFEVYMPDAEREIVIRGVPLKDKVSYIISKPNYVTVREANAVTAKMD